jgi:UDP-glucose 6-dehydrogenase
MNKVVIFGKGKVGEATAHSFTQHNPHVEIVWIDPQKGLDAGDIQDANFAVICVPSLINGPYDHSAVDQALLRLHEAKFVGITAIRSTVTPEWITSRARTFEHLNIIHFPEFMKQHGDHVNDKPWIVVLGGQTEYTSLFGNFLSTCLYGDPKTYVYTDVASSTIIKLGQNGFLATKVSYFNMISELCEAHGVDYSVVRDAITIDDRINSKHTDVPGWDGQKGYGGHCLPKDTSALARAVRGCDILASVISYNGRIRGGKNIQTQ